MALVSQNAPQGGLVIPLWKEVSVQVTEEKSVVALVQEVNPLDTITGHGPGEGGCTQSPENKDRNKVQTNIVNVFTTNSCIEM